jgi:chromosome segregation ATPase
MPERFREMEKAALAKGNEVQPSEEEIRPSERGFLRRLREYPELQAKIETMLAIIENAGGDVEKAAEAERRIIEELQQMGNEVLHGWARRQQQKKEEEYNAKPGMNRKEKNPLLVCATGENRNSRTEIFTRGRQGPQIRPFSESAGVECRGYSEALQRAMSDFGAGHAFAGAASKLKARAAALRWLYDLETPFESSPVMVWPN